MWKWAWTVRVGKQCQVGKTGKTIKLYYYYQHQQSLLCKAEWRALQLYLFAESWDEDKDKHESERERDKPGSQIRHKLTAKSETPATNLLPFFIFLPAGFFYFFTQTMKLILNYFAWRNNIFGILGALSIYFIFHKTYRFRFATAKRAMKNCRHNCQMIVTIYPAREEYSVVASTNLSPSSSSSLIECQFGVSSVPPPAPHLTPVPITLRNILVLSPSFLLF